MRFASTFAAALLAVTTLASPVLAFDVQNGGGAPAGSSANLAPDASAAGVSLDMDLKAQLGISDENTKSSLLPKSGLSFGGGVFNGSSSANQTTLGYDDSPWVAPRRPAGRD